MTVKGLIDVRIPPGVTRDVTYASNNEAFVTLYNFFNGLSSIGVTRIAYNVGSSGTGMDFWDHTGYPGNGAWALFRFGNAQIPFYVLLQGANLRTANSFTYSSYAGCLPCQNTGNITSTGGNSTVSIAIASRVDGGSPWNGTTNNNGTDTKGSTVWTAGGSTLAVWPRCNSTSIGGTTTNKESVSLVVYSGNISSLDNFFDSYNLGGKLNCIADENNFIIVADGGNNSSMSFFFFGNYVVRSSMAAQIPYVCLSNAKPNNPPFVQYNATYRYGSYHISDNNNMTWGSQSGDGGICHPNATFGVRACAIETANNYLSNTINLMNPNIVSSIGSRFDTFPIVVALDEKPYFGIVGTLSFIRYCAMVPPLTLTSDRRYLVVGTSATDSIKLVIPWDGKTMPGSTKSRSGVSF